MTLLARLAPRATKATVSSISSDGTFLVAPWWNQLLGWVPTRAGTTIDEQSALALPIVYACVRVIAESIASLPLITYRRTPEGGKERATDNPYYSLFHDAPNPAMTSFGWRETLMTHLTTWGNGYNEITETGFGTEVWPLPPHRMEVGWESGRKVFDYLTDAGQKKRLDSKRVWHIPGLSTNGLVGLSPIQAHRESLGEMLATRDFGSSFYRNNARPAAVLEHPANLSAGAIERLATQMDQLRGTGNAGKTIVMEEGMKLHEVGVPPEDAQYIETRKLQREDVCSIYRMPPHMVGVLDHATFCLPGSELVYTTAGPRPIRDITPGTEVWSRGTAGLVRGAVKATALSGYDRVLTLRTTNRELRVTANHRVLARRAFAKATVTTMGGRPVEGGWQRVIWQTEWVKASELEVGDTLVALDRLPDEGTAHAPTRPNVSVGFMEFAGLLVGDGNVYSGSVTIARSEAALYMDHYRQVIRDEFTRHDGGPVTLVEGGRQTRFASVTAARELAFLGFSGTARTKRVPGWVFGLGADLRLAFLRGYLDADGTVDKLGRISFSSAGQGLADDMRHLCMGLGIPVTNIREYTPASSMLNGRPVVPTGPHYTFTCSDPGSNVRIGSHDSRYTARLATGRPFGRKGRAYPRHGGVGFDEAGLGLSRINSITTGDILEPVFDLQVEGTASFIASGVVVHNSNIEHQSIDFVVHTLRPWLVRLEQSIKSFFLADQPDIFVEFLVDGLLRGDAEARSRALATQLEHEVITVNEWREIENRNPYPVNVRWTPAANYTAEEIDEDGNIVQPEAPPEVPAAAEPTPPGQPPQLTVIKSAAVRCAYERNGVRCNRLLGDPLTPPYSVTCPRCKGVTASTETKSAGDLVEPTADELRSVLADLALGISALASRPAVPTELVALTEAMRQQGDAIGRLADREPVAVVEQAARTLRIVRTEDGALISETA